MIVNKNLDEIVHACKTSFEKKNTHNLVSNSINKNAIL